MINILPRVLISSLFIVSGLYFLFYDFNTYVGFIELKHIPYAKMVAYITLIFKIVVGILLLFGVATKVSVGLLLLFTLLVTAIYHNPIQNPSELMNLLKNLAVMGGLCLLYKN